MATKTVTANKSSQFRSPDKGAGADSHIAIGDNGYTWRAAIDFPAIDWGALAGRQIEYAELHLYTTWEQHLSFSADPDAYARRITASWTANSGDVEGSGLSTDPTAYPGPTATATGQGQADINPSKNTWDKIDVTSIIESWAPSNVYKSDGSTGDGTTQYGILLQAVSEAQGADKVEWKSAEASSQKPYLTIVYSDVGLPVATIDEIAGSTDDGGAITDTTPEIRWSGENPDGEQDPPQSGWRAQIAEVASYGTEPSDWGTSPQFEEEAEGSLPDWDTQAVEVFNTTKTLGKWYAFRASAINQWGLEGFSPTQWRFLTRAPTAPTLIGGVVDIHNLGALAVWTSGGSHAKPVWEFTVSDPDNDSIIAIELRLKNSPSGAPFATETHTGEWLSGSTARLEANTALVNRQTYYADVRIKDANGAWSGYSTEITFKVSWGQSIFEHNAGAGSSQWLLETGTLAGTGARMATVFSAASGASGSGRGSWYSNIGEVPIQAYANIMVRLCNVGATVSTRATLADMTLSYAGSVSTPDHWQYSPTAEWVLDLAARRYGSRAFKCEVDTGSNGTANRYIYPFRNSVGDDIPVQPNTTYVWSAWVKTVGAGGLGGTGLFLEVYADSGATLIGTNVAEQGYVTDSASEQDGWQRIWMEFTSGPGQYLVRPRVTYDPDGSNGDGDVFFVDAVMLEESTVVSPWGPGLVGNAIVIDTGGIAIDATAGASFRLRGDTGGTRDTVELGNKGLVFGGDAEIYSDAANTIRIDEKLDLNGNLEVSGTITGPTAITTSGTVTATNVSPANNVQTFTNNGTWTKPAGNYRMAKVIVVGGGGGGGGGGRHANGQHRLGGSGGGGGGCAVVDIPIGDMGATESVTIGQGGSGGAGVSVNDTNGNAGTDGGDTSLGAQVSAGGGQAGVGGRTGSGGTRGGQGGFGTYPGQMGGAGNNSTGRAGGYIISDDADGEETVGVSSAGGAGGGGGAGGKNSSDTNAAGGAGGESGTGIGGGSGGAVGGAEGGNGSNGSGDKAYVRVGGGGGGGAGRTGAGTGGDGGDGGLYGGGGGGGGAANNSGTSDPGGDGADGFCAVICY